MRRAAPRVVFFDALGTLFRLTPPHEIVRQVMTRQNHPMTESEALSKLERANPVVARRGPPARSNRYRGAR
ncbi:MAG: hypothetical protein WKH64_02190 [Chloroflexia bacterium]